MNILDEIIAHKRLEVAERKKQITLKDLEQQIDGQQIPPSLRKHLLAPDKNGIIAEFKRRSPSKDWINKKAQVENVIPLYEQAGVSGISVLTDEHFFGGHADDLIKAHAQCAIPILRKDFIIDPFQIVEARAIGASAILLIASVLSTKEVHAFAQVAKDYDLDVLFEVHDMEELDKLSPLIQIVGVNNRNLKTFVVDIENSIRIAQQIPNSYVKVAESGISNVASITYLKQHGFNGFLIGENFMKTTNPGKAATDFSNELLKSDKSL